MSKKRAIKPDLIFILYQHYNKYSLTKVQRFQEKKNAAFRYISRLIIIFNINILILLANIIDIDNAALYYLVVRLALFIIPEIYYIKHTDIYNK